MTINNNSNPDLQISELSGQDPHVIEDLFNSTFKKQLQDDQLTVEREHGSTVEWGVDRKKYDPIEDPKFGKGIKVFRQLFPRHTEITWNDVMPKIQEEFNDETLRVMYPESEGDDLITTNVTDNSHMKHPHGVTIEKPHIPRLPCLVTHQHQYSNHVIKSAMLEAYKEVGVRWVHMYMTFIKDCFLFRRHYDPHCVFIIAAMGEVEYELDYKSTKEEDREGNKDDLYHKRIETPDLPAETVLLKPGDGIYIPRGVWHKPRTFGPRITCSYNWSYTI